MKLKIMTFNLRTSYASCDGINSFENRKPYILDLINQHAPHLIGFQEVTDLMLDFLYEAIGAQYRIVACGREKNYHGECTAIAYRRSEFVNIKSETFWLSPTPEIPGSSYGMDQSKCPRVTTYAVLKPEALDRPILFANTHFDHEGALARLRSAEQMTQFFKSFDMPVFFTGDFNDLPDSAPITLLKTALTDMSADIGPTFHAYGSQKHPHIKIDYVFTTLKGASYSAELISDGPFDGIYPSDHYPVLVNVDID